MSRKEKAVVVWLLTHAADAALDKQGKKINAPWWQIEIAKLVIATAIASVI